MTSLHTGTEFVDADVPLDGEVFHGCRFHGCKLIYSGGATPTLVDCEFIDPSFSFDGAAQRTLQLLSAFYRGGMQHVVENTFDNIRQGPE